MSGGAEKRASILPTKEPKGIGFLGPDYQFDEELIKPRDIGVRRDDSLDSVFDAVQGVAYYMDTIAFGEASTPLTSGKRFKKYGTNYFLNTGSRCSNGADMWHYMELIPKGDAIGETIKEAMAGIGLAPLRGLAPGAIEDVKGAVNLDPAMKSIFGKGYPKCVLATLPVGDEDKNIKNNKTKNSWVDDPTSVKDCALWPNGWNITGPYSGVKPGSGRTNRRACQTKWVLEKLVDKKEWDADKKTRNRDGTPIKETTEGFDDSGMPNRWLLLMLGAVTAANFWAYSRR
jgi:hypothetical protein